ncbi:HAD-IC family P-type ATPase [Peptococcaceae bacterium]|nr:HAD-IC family P-type ATPase [Peptococcaceae bacterium]MCL0062956.1 HAD-IC family P-type ATPase [Peptococcaceae bacterium]
MKKDENWFELEISEVLKKLNTDLKTGLSEQEALKRLKQFGKNEIPVKTRSSIVRFLLQFHNPLLYVLMVAALVAFLLDKMLDMWVIIAVILATAIIGFIQEGKAEKAILALRKMMMPTCNVIRNGEKKSIPVSDLVPGDIVLLESGDQVPADLRLFQCKDLAVDEAIITGESVPVAKSTKALKDPNLSISEQVNMAFCGTFVTRGTARGIVVATGLNTQMGKISGIITATTKAQPPILTKISEFTKTIMAAIFILGAINTAISWKLEYPLDVIFLATVGIIVAMVPEGLPAALISAFSIGVMAMAKRNVLIRRLPAVETLGCTTVICSDKTGTLTKNQMTVRSIYCGGRFFDVTGSGYNPEGDFYINNHKIQVSNSKHQCLHKTLLAGYMCNDASLIKQNGNYTINGDPTEGALLVAAAKAGIDAKHDRIDEIPFSSELQYMATLHKFDNNKNVIFLKGSPEKVMSLCSEQLIDNNSTEPLNKTQISKAADEMASKALRVLAMAFKHVPADKTSIDQSDLKNMTFLGLQGMIDPPREEVVEAIKRCKRAGIRVVMITGDHARTARAIADQLQIGVEEKRVVTGHDLENMSDEELYKTVNSVSVYARAAPEHKYRIVKQLKRHNNIVAVTGDGVNDAPALSTADIGIAMGITGTQVTKEASDMILADDNFASIVKGVEEGRHVFNNIWKVILYLLPTNGGQGLVLLSAIALAPFIPVFAQTLPIQPIQILWVNLAIAIACAIPLTIEPKEPDLLNKLPRNPKEKLVNKLFIIKVLTVSVVSAVSALTIFLAYCYSHIDNHILTDKVLTEAQTAAFTTIIFVQVMYLFAARRPYTPIFKYNLFSNKWVITGAAATILLQLIIVYSEPIFGFSPFRTQPFDAEWWLYILLASIIGLFIIEIEKMILKNRKKG